MHNPIALLGDIATVAVSESTGTSTYNSVTGRFSSTTTVNMLRSPSSKGSSACRPARRSSWATPKPMPPTPPGWRAGPPRTP